MWSTNLGVHQATDFLSEHWTDRCSKQFSISRQSSETGYQNTHNTAYMSYILGNVPCQLSCMGDGLVRMQTGTESLLYSYFSNNVWIVLNQTTANGLSFNFLPACIQFKRYFMTTERFCLDVCNCIFTLFIAFCLLSNITCLRCCMSCGHYIWNNSQQ